MAKRAIPRRKGAHPVPDSNQVWYLLLHLGVPSASGGHRAAHLTTAREACHKAGLSLAVFPLSSGRRFSPHNRYFFRLPRYKRDDRFAAYIGETIFNLAWVTCGPLGTSDDRAGVFRLPRDLLDPGLPLSLDVLARLEYSRGWPDRVLYFPHDTIGSFTTFAEFHVEEMWRRLPIVLTQEHLSRAARFLKTSLENFYVYPGQIPEDVSDPTVTAQSPSEQTHLETALHSAFMALEAILGDLPKDDRKLARKLQALGFDPAQPAGYSTKKPIIRAIRDFNLARDKKAAHGSTSERSITVLETLEFQTCGRYIVEAALDMAQGS